MEREREEEKLAIMELDADPVAHLRHRSPQHAKQPPNGNAAWQSDLSTSGEGEGEGDWTHTEV